MALVVAAAVAAVVAALNLTALDMASTSTDTLTTLVMDCL